MENKPIIDRDPELWKLAKKRANFKRHLYTYIILNIFFWALWYFSKEDASDTPGMPWPAWASLGWGIGLAMDYYNSYFGDKEGMSEKEYEKLVRSRQNRENTPL